MNAQTERLHKLDDAKLIDLVKNYRQYGCDDAMRNAAIDILDERGITIDDLKFGGNFVNTQYDEAAECYRIYEQNSKSAMVLYFLSLASIVLLPWVEWPNNIVATIVVGTKLIIYVCFITNVARTYISQSNFYKTIGKQLGKGDQILFFILGIPLYIFLHFFYGSRMKEEMNAIQ